ncbi:hypothetical protein HOD96_01395 [Candidatus Falkowbacteria bacterium]|jgi:guanylate kinase|nr:hypothetical protein [Candidatus Falkowbacteria bacterium]MBT4432869.1 hypothetical protein [Candidatus Falkowbacteria bacterium]
MIEQNKKVIVIAGPTGSGESTITNKIIEKYPNYTRLVTATTRQPRLKEKQAVDYYFFSKEIFLQEIKKGNIIEYTYVKNRDVYYGSYKLDLEEKFKKGLTVVVNPDIVGTKYYKKYYNAVTIFIKPQSINDLTGRLKKRDPSISKEELKNRIEDAKREIEEEEQFYDYIVINHENKLDEAILEVENIITKKRAKKTG